MELRFQDSDWEEKGEVSRDLMLILVTTEELFGASGERWRYGTSTQTLELDLPGAPTGVCEDVLTRIYTATLDRGIDMNSGHCRCGDKW